MIKYLSEEGILATHDEIIEKIGGLPGIRSSVSAVLHRVEQAVYYNNINDLHEIAALYTISLAQGHVFNDGNKRTSLMALYDFFWLNGLLLDAPLKLRKSSFP